MKKSIEEWTMQNDQTEYEFLKSIYLALISADNHRHYDVYEVDRLFSTAERLAVKFLENAFQKGWMPVQFFESEEIKKDETHLS